MCVSRVGIHITLPQRTWPARTIHPRSEPTDWDLCHLSTKPFQLPCPPLDRRPCSNASLFLPHHLPLTLFKSGNLESNPYFHSHFTTTSHILAYRSIHPTSFPPIAWPETRTPAHVLPRPFLHKPQPHVLRKPINRWCGLRYWFSASERWR